VSGRIQPFATFASRRVRCDALLGRRPLPPPSAGLAEDACALYLFRFDSAVDASRLQCLVRRDVLGFDTCSTAAGASACQPGGVVPTPPPPPGAAAPVADPAMEADVLAARWVYVVEAAVHAYFSTCWDLAGEVVAVNLPVLEGVRRAYPRERDGGRRDTRPAASRPSDLPSLASAASNGSASSVSLVSTGSTPPASPATPAARTVADDLPLLTLPDDANDTSPVVTMPADGRADRPTCGGSPPSLPAHAAALAARAAAVAAMTASTPPPPTSVDAGTVVVIRSEAHFASAVLHSPRPVVVKWFAQYCSECAALAPHFAAAAASLAGRVTFASIDGPLLPALRVRHGVTAYPQVALFHQGVLLTWRSRSAPRTAASLVAFATSAEGTDDGTGRTPVVIEEAVEEGEEEEADAAAARRARAAVAAADAEEAADLESPGAVLTRTLGEPPSPMGAATWSQLLRKQGIDELHALLHDRQQAMQSEIRRSLANAAVASPPCDANALSCPVPAPTPPPPPARLAGPDTPPPVIIFLGGGMGAGKTSAVARIQGSPFWARYGDRVVVVEADNLKEADPLFIALRGVTPAAARMVHNESVAAAEELFLRAVMARRDVVFDGTMAWRPFVEQTLAMIRDTAHVYRRGPGDGDGSRPPVYWEVAGVRAEAAVPYHVEMVGVTVDAEVAVQRGMVRMMSSGRGVPLRAQLSSHQLFSANFEAYVPMFDGAYLLDNGSAVGDGCLTPVGKAAAVAAAAAAASAGGGVAEAATPTPPAPPSDDGEGMENLVACKNGVLFDGGGDPGVFHVRCPRAWARFLRKAHLNPDASGVADLYAAGDAQ